MMHQPGDQPSQNKIRQDREEDGHDDRLNKLPIGMYVVLTEIFNLQGKTKKFKNRGHRCRKCPF